MMKVIRVSWTELHLQSSPLRVNCAGRFYGRTRRGALAVDFLLLIAHDVTRAQRSH